MNRYYENNLVPASGFPQKSHAINTTDDIKVLRCCLAKSLDFGSALLIYLLMYKSLMFSLINVYVLHT